MKKKTKNIILNSISALIILVTFAQFLTPIIHPDCIEVFSQNKNEDNIVSSLVSEYPQGNIVNQIKKYNRTTENESNNYNHIYKYKFATNVDVEKYTNIKLLYTFQIMTKLNKTRFSLNHLDLRSPPTFHS